MRARPSKGNPIPTRSRELLRSRDGGACVRCGLAAGEWHHRRSRRVRDEHTHCPCNGVTLCAACHRAVHALPQASRDLGLIVSREETHPGRVAVKGYAGWLVLGCDGNLSRTTFPSESQGG